MMMRKQRDTGRVDTQCVVGSYRIPFATRADYLRWHDAIRSAVGFEKEIHQERDQTTPK
jgi:hypothetical protein